MRSAATGIALYCSDVQRHPRARAALPWCSLCSAAVSAVSVRDRRGALRCVSVRLLSRWRDLDGDSRGLSSPASC